MLEGGFFRLTSRKMEETTFQELTVRIGVPYIYVHQGNCEHMLIVSDVR
jgi:snRNA-activating protein complex subunit 3